MRRRIVTLAIGAALALTTLAAAAHPPDSLSLSPLSVLGSADAAVTKSLSGDGGGGNVGGSGTRLADLLSGIAAPVVIALAGILLIGTLATRNIGASAGIVVITLIGLIFLLSPGSIESTAKALANVVF
jgi:hypothetical protein